MNAVMIVERRCVMLLPTDHAEALGNSARQSRAFRFRYPFDG